MIHIMNKTAAHPPATATVANEDAGMLGILQVARVLQTQLEAALDSVGLSAPKYHALEALVRADDSVPLSVLADRQQCVRSNITQLVDRLEADGLVKRVNDPEDRRCVRAVITELGAERFAAGTEAIRKVQADLTAGVSAADRAHFLRILSEFQAR
jgi:DNA-binding MarR family transcriptional regulator